MSGASYIHFQRDRNPYLFYPVHVCTSFRLWEALFHWSLGLLPLHTIPLNSVGFCMSILACFGSRCRHQLQRIIPPRFELCSFFLTSIEPTELSVFNIASDESLERSIQFVNERWVVLLSDVSVVLWSRMESLGLGSGLNYLSSERSDVVNIVNTVYRLVEKIRLQKKQLEEVCFLPHGLLSSSIAFKSVVNRPSVMYVF